MGESLPTRARICLLLKEQLDGWSRPGHYLAVNSLPDIYAGRHPEDVPAYAF